MYIVVGLGNPGLKYENNRHNIGFKIIDKIAENYNVNINKSKFKSQYNEIRIGSKKVLLIKPQTYMNNSGEAIKEIKSFFSVETENIIVIHDDIDLDYGRIKVKKNGGSGTHNGLRSILNHIKEKDFPRVRVGVGKPIEHIDLADYVLGNFNKDEVKILEKILDESIEIVESIVKDGVDIAMNKHNGKDIKA